MVTCLDDGVQASSDPAPPTSYAVSRLVPTGGRPRIEIDPSFLAQALPLRNKKRIGEAVNASSRTVRRRAGELGLQHLEAAPYQDVQNAEGEVTREWNSDPRRAATNLTDQELQQQVTELLQRFPHYGRNMLKGALNAKGFIFTIKRLREAYAAVHGPAAVFGHRPIRRRIYSVPGVNSLWHHDGQHGMFHPFS